MGAVLGVVTTWLLYQNSAAFSMFTAPYPIAWTQIEGVGGGDAAGLVARDHRPGVACCRNRARHRRSGCRLTVTAAR